MGRAYQNRKESMAKTSANKSKVYGKYGREIYVVAKSGGLTPVATWLCAASSSAPSVIRCRRM